MSTLILNYIWIYRYFGFTEKTKIKVVNIYVYLIVEMIMEIFL